MRKKILVVNPNTSKTMTETIAKSANSASQPFGLFLECETVCCNKGVSSVEGSFDDAVSTYWTLEKVLPVISQYNAVLIACFSNHGAVSALREATPIPVMHIMEASILQALPLGAKYSIITTSDRWRLLLEDGVRCIGLHENCASVRAVDISSLDTVSSDKNEIVKRIVEVGRLAIRVDHADVIILGCAGLAGLQKIVSDELKIPVLDPVDSGICALAHLLATECKTVGKCTTSIKRRRNEVNIEEPGILAAYGCR